MIKIKSFILDETNWLEVTWIDEVVSINEETKEETITETQVHCESYSGHPEHIQMLRNKAAELGTSLDEYEELIAKVQSEFVVPTEAELLAYEQEQKIAECTTYLAMTDWVEPYLIRHELGLEVLAADSEKLVIKGKRAEAKAFLKSVGA